MGKTQIKIIIYILILGYISFSCSKEDGENINPNIQQTEWAQSSSVFDGIINGAMIDGKLILMGYNSIYNDVQLNVENNPFIFEKFISRPGWYKLPISSKILASRTETDIYIAPLSNLQESSFVKIDPRSYDASFTGFEDIPRWQSEALGISGSGAVLVPYRTSQEGIAENNPSFFLIQTSLNGQELTVINIVSIKPQVIDYYDQIYQIVSFEDYFIINIAGEVLQISDQGETTRIGSYNSYKTVILKDEMYSFGTHNTNQEITLYKSNKNGTQRQIANKFPIDPVFANLQLTTINDQIIGFNNDKIYLVNVGTNRLSLTELNNSKLEGGFISSINQVNSETVLVTTTCNAVCGSFTKRISNFFEEKKN
ncbi:hypothetical protein MM236_19220 [Belliella sp. DSM 107340]|uniref:TolB-like 6-blade propeller-like n=1 Tax=Belliella calami TaxID=2923436 RepID=A0ABS9UV92_9BACT|nr:hypothetical protein [Belliella calami]MCH7400135.1 hypothetical protein [Belliella calami]